MHHYIDTSATAAQVQLNDTIDHIVQGANSKSLLFITSLIVAKYKCPDCNDWHLDTKVLRTVLISSPRGGQ